MRLAQLLYSDAEYPLQTLLCDIGITDIKLPHIPIYNDTLNINDINTILTTFDKLAEISIVNDIIHKYMNKKHGSALCIINHTCDDVVNAYARRYILVFNNAMTELNYICNIKSALKNGLYIKDLRYDENVIDNSGNNAPCNLFAKTLKKLCIDEFECIIDDTELANCTFIENLKIYSIGSHITTFKPFAKSLKSVCLISFCEVDDKILRSCTSITKLDVDGNKNITSCDAFANTLRILNASNSYGWESICGISDAGLYKCTKIEVLYASFNNNITTCNQFAKTLRILHADSCGISTDGLKLCTQIKELNANDNNRITTCAPFAQSLRILFASECGICDNGLTLCTQITKLCASNNPKITTCVPFAKTLRILSACGSCGINDDGIKFCTRIEKLFVGYNNNITTCAPFAKSLLELYAYNNCGIGDSGLALCINIKELYADNNCKITSCVPFAKTLRVLSASGTCGIDDYNLKLCTSITKLYPDKNDKITMHIKPHK